MTLIVNELDTPISQTLTTPNRNVMVAAVRPHLYLHNHPSGSLYVQINTVDGDLVALSETISCSAITSANYFHGKQTFYIQAYLRKNTNYIFYVVGTGGYSHSSSAFVGVCNDYDLRIYDLDFTPSNDLHAPLCMEIWERSVK